MNRGVEIASDVADSARAVILEQVSNGVAVRMAVLYLLLGGHAWEGECVSGQLSIRGGRVVDPAAGRDERVGRPARRRRRRRGGRRPAAFRRARRSTRRACSSSRASSTCTRTCASPGASTPRRSHSGLAAAAAGGFTAVCAMPNTDPVNDNRAVTEFLVSRAQSATGARASIRSARSRRARRARSWRSSARCEIAGAVAVSDDGQWLADGRAPAPGLRARGALRDAGRPARRGPDALRAARRCTRAPSRRASACRHSRRSPRPRPWRATCSSRRSRGGRLHVAHLSTARALELVREARRPRDSP